MKTKIKKPTLPTKKEHNKEQVATNNEKAAFLATLTDKQRTEFNDLEDSVRKLEKDGISFYLFAYMPTPVEPTERAMWQYNSLVSNTIKFDKEGKITKKSLIESNKIFDSLLFAVYGMTEHIFSDLFKKRNMYEQVTEFSKVLANAIYNTRARIYKNMVDKKDDGK